MKENSKLTGFHPSVKIIDTTLRDGGLVNDFYFEKLFEKALYETNVKAGIDVMEFGYKADKDLFDINRFGPCKFCDDEYIRSIVGENKTDLKISVMADVGRCNYKRDIIEKKNSPVDIVRVACYLKEIPTAIDIIEECTKKGYETTCNIMAISTTQERDLQVALDLLCKSPVKVVYIVDSYGAIYPEEMARFCNIFGEYAAKYSKQIGIHAHDNLHLAFANTIECINNGVNYLDATYMAMGRGAGNCSIESLIGFLKNPKYQISFILKFLENYMIPFKDSGIAWGYDTQYLLTGLLNQHPRTAISFTKEKRKDIFNYYKEITSQE